MLDDGTKPEYGKNTDFWSSVFELVKAFRALLLLVLVSFAKAHGLPTGGASVPSPARPNIVLILADDLGYGDLGCQNPRSKIPTPHLDRLASQGMRFTDAHASSALCTPSRYSLLTGQHCWRSRLKQGVLNMWDEPLIRPEQLTIAGMLRNQGYRTSCFGKWHLGLAWPFKGVVAQGFDTQVSSADINWSRRISGGPVDCGFDYYFGVNVPNEPPYAFIENDHVVGVPAVDYPTVKGQQGHWAGPGVAGWDWTQVLPQITSNTVRWIEGATSAAQPFFLYASLVGPHQPVVPAAQFQGASGAGAYGDYVAEVDWAVGQVLEALEAAGVATNTLVLFTSDNGPDAFAYARIQQYRHESMGELRGIKSDIWEGGHRVPFIASWPGTVAAGTTNAQTICLIDLIRTLAQVVGAELPASAGQDSVSFLPALLGNVPNGLSNRLLLLESGMGQFGIRSNSWMYIDSSTGDGHNPELEPMWFKRYRKYGSEQPRPALLYDLNKDLAQGTNLLDSRPRIAGELRAQLISQRSKVIWNGARSHDWGTGRNWLLASGPAGADVLYTNVPGLANFEQTLANSFAINTLTLDASVSNEVQITAKSAGRLMIANGIDLTAANVDLNIAAPVQLNQSQVWGLGVGRRLTIARPLALNDFTLSLCGEGDAYLSGPISGSGELRLRNSGDTVLAGMNTFSGVVELSGGGVLVARANAALGQATVLIPNNSTLQLAPGVIITNRAFVYGYGAQRGGIAFGAINLRGQGSGTYAGPIVLSGNTGIGCRDIGGVLRIAGTIAGDANLLIMPGAGLTVFGTNQLYSGRTLLYGRLQLSRGHGRLPSGTDLVLAVGASAQLDLNGNDQTLASINGVGALGGNISLGGATLTVTPSRLDMYRGNISGPGNLEVAGSGTWVLSGSNTFTGSTTIRSGFLVVNGSLGGDLVNVQGGTLSGSGSFTSPVVVGNGGALDLLVASRPLTIHNALTLSPGSRTSIALDPLHGQNGGIRGLTSASYGGILVVSNMSPATVFRAGQQFAIFSAQESGGNFSQITPAPGPGLAWRFEPARGVLAVVVQPALHVVSTATIPSVLSWRGSGFHLQVLTNAHNLATPDAWVDYPGGGISPVVLPHDLGTNPVFFRLVSP